MKASGPCWRITGLRRQVVGGVDRVLADVEGRTVWFESEDVELHPSPEAFASLLFIPALHNGATVRVDAPLDPVWISGTAHLPAIYSRWWGYRDAYPIEDSGATSPATEPASAAAACFTGGVDSFHTLLTAGERFERLFYVHGYDIGLDDHVRMAAFQRSLDEVSERIGKRALKLRTNAREHPIVMSVSWDRVHGAALAAAAHGLSGEIGTLIVPSSYARSNLIPWGSHPTTDSLWSTSRLAVVHEDVSPNRQDKIRRIVSDPLVWRHLRVCWENRAPAGNCSACQKCVRTMVVISGYGRLADFTVFDHSVPLTSRLDALRPIPARLVNPWRGVLDVDLALDVRAAVLRLLDRSDRGPVHRVARLMRRLVRRGSG